MVSLLVLIAAVQPGAPVVLAEGIGSAIPLDRSEILCAGAGGRLFTVDVSTGEAAPWIMSWSPDDDGWLADGGLYALVVSPDGEWVCLAMSVRLPESFDVPDGSEGMRSAFVGILARSDGSDAKPVFVGIAAGGGPVYEFTADSRFLVGSPMFPCDPSPGGYSAFLKEGWDDPGLQAFDAVGTATGGRALLDVPGLGDGFLKCPYSDNFRIENNWYEVHEFASFTDPGVMGRWEAPEGVAQDFRGWVLPDAVLVCIDGRPYLLFVDGTTRESFLPFCPDPLAWLPDGSYLIASPEDPGMVQHARIDWDSPEVTVLGSFPLPEEVEGCAPVPMPGSQGVFCIDRRGAGNLYYIELPQASP